MFVVMDALGNVFVDEVLIPHGYENDDCQELDDHDFRSEHLRVFVRTPKVPLQIFR